MTKYLEKKKRGKKVKNELVNEALETCISV